MKIRVHVFEKVRHAFEFEADSIEDGLKKLDDELDATLGNWLESEGVREFSDEVCIDPLKAGQRRRVMSKEKKNEPLRFGKHGDAAVSAPRYVRKIGKGYEYGEIEVNWDDRTKDKNRPLGKAPTLDEALAINQMAAMTEQTPTYRVGSPLYCRSTGGVQ